MTTDHKTEMMRFAYRATCRTCGEPVANRRVVIVEVADGYAVCELQLTSCLYVLCDDHTVEPLRLWDCDACAPDDATHCPTMAVRLSTFGAGSLPVRMHCAGCTLGHREFVEAGPRYELWRCGHCPHSPSNRRKHD